MQSFDKLEAFGDVQRGDINGWAVATDGYAAIAVKLGENEAWQCKAPTKEGKRPTLKAVFEMVGEAVSGRSLGEPVSVEDLPYEPLMDPPPCPECDGDGLCPRCGEGACDECHGEGTVKPFREREYVVNLRSVHVCRSRLSVILDIVGCEGTVTLYRAMLNGEPALGLDGEGWKACLMSHTGEVREDWG